MGYRRVSRNACLGDSVFWVGHDDSIGKKDVLMGWLGKLTSWLLGAFQVGHAFLETCLKAMMGKLYLLFLPLIAVIKMIYDFNRALTNKIIALMNSVEGYSLESIPDSNFITWVNYWFPLDTLMNVILMVITFAIACLKIRFMLKLKKIILF